MMPRITRGRYCGFEANFIAGEYSKRRSGKEIRKNEEKTVDFDRMCAGNGGGP